MPIDQHSDPSPGAEGATAVERPTPDREDLAQAVRLPDLGEHVNHPGRVVSVDPGEAAAGGDESGRVLSPGPADAESSWDRDGLPSR